MPTVHDVRDLRNSICGHLEILAHLATIGDAEIQKEVRYALGWITSESIGHDQVIREVRKASSHPANDAARGQALVERLCRGISEFDSLVRSGTVDQSLAPVD